MTPTAAEIVARLSDIRTGGGNEAETRFKVIDHILTHILRWKAADFNLEERITEDDGEFFLDYLVQTAQTSLLIEAKRAQVDFSKLPSSRRAALKGSWMKGDLKKAILQARDYGRKRGVGFCAATNGDAWIIFPVNRRDLVSFEDTYAVIVHNAQCALDTDFIDAPHIQSVLSKRFSIAEQLLKGKQFDAVTDGGAKITVSDASKVIEMLSASVLGTEVGNLIEVSATGDVRLALSMTKQFLQFGYSASSKAYIAFEQSGRYHFPVHEAIRAIMLGNQSIYRDEFSPFLNPFDAKTGRSESQFLRLYIMSALVWAASTKTFQGIEAGEIISSLEKLGFSRRITDKVIADLIGGRLCFSRSHQEYTTDSVLIPTRLCGFVVRDLIGRLVFIETTVFDTFIYDDFAWEEIRLLMKDIYNEGNIVTKFRKRKEVARKFYSWVETEVQKLCVEAARRNLGPFWTNNPLTRMRDEFDRELERALRSAVRNYGSERDRLIMGLPLFRDVDANGRSIER